MTRWRPLRPGQQYRRFDGDDGDGDGGFDYFVYDDDGELLGIIHPTYRVHARTGERLHGKARSAWRTWSHYLRTGGGHYRTRAAARAALQGDRAAQPFWLRYDTSQLQRLATTP